MEQQVMNREIDRRQFLSTAAKIGGAMMAVAQITDTLAKADPPPTAPALTQAPVDGKRLKKLFLFDRESVAAAADTVTFHLNQATKRPENPVLIPGEPQQWDSLQVIWPGTVLYDADDKLFRAWYNGMDAVQAGRPALPWSPGYAESTDGFHWTKPELGQYTHNGLPTNRLKPEWTKSFDNAYINLSTVLKNPDQSNPERKFLALWHVGEKQNTQMKKLLCSSPDGKVWKDETVVFEPLDGYGWNFLDTTSVIFQPEATDENERVLVYGQVFGPASRVVGRASGASLASFKFPGARGPEWFLLGPEKGIDEEIHFAAVKKIGGQFLMLFESDRFSQKPLHGDLRLAISSDGKKFRRVHPQTPLVATGSRGMWDENLLVVTTSAMQEVGDEIWIFYFGCPNIFTNWPGSYAAKGGPRGSMVYPSYLGVATLPRDRFAYAAGPGSVTTPSLTVGDQGLWLNADGDGITVTAIDAAGATLAEGQLAAAQPNVLERAVQWTGNPPSQPYQVRIGLRDGQRLYAVGY
jgi:hypothetical protein